MIRISLYKKSVSVLLVLAYLLIGSGIGNALIWCQESESYSHLEYNPAGECQDLCLPEKPGNKIDGRQAAYAVLQSFENDCLDSQTHLFHAPVPAAERLLTDSPASGWTAIFPFPSLGNPPTTILARLNLVAQPPPLHALVALRTVVLLN